MLKLVWSELALDELAAIIRYIRDRNFAAADKLRHQIETCAERLPAHPFMHRPGRVPGTREAVVHPNYIVIYEVALDEVVIRNVVHSRREYPAAD